MIQRATSSGGTTATAEAPARPDPRDTSPGSRPGQEAAEEAIQRLRLAESDVFEAVTALQVENEGLRMQLADREDLEAAHGILKQENKELRDLIAKLARSARELVQAPKVAHSYPLPGGNGRAQAVLADGRVFVQQIVETGLAWNPADPIPGTPTAILFEIEQSVGRVLDAEVQS